MSTKFAEVTTLLVLLSASAPALAGKAAQDARRAARTFIAEHRAQLESSDEQVLSGQVGPHEVKWFGTALHVTSPTRDGTVTRAYQVQRHFPYELDDRGRAQGTSATNTDGSNAGIWSKQAEFRRGPYRDGIPDASTVHVRASGSTLRKTQQVPGSAAISSLQTRDKWVQFLDTDGDPILSIDTQVARNDVVVRDDQGKVVHRVRYRGPDRSGPVTQVPLERVAHKTFDYVVWKARAR